MTRGFLLCTTKTVRFASPIPVQRINREPSPSVDPFAMTDHRPRPPPNDSHSQSHRVSPSASHQNQFSGHHIGYPNPPDAANPDPVTLKDQWRFATRQYSRWYGHAWGTAIVAGMAFFALGWFIKGGNPLPSGHDDSRPHVGSGSSSESESK